MSTTPATTGSIGQQQLPALTINIPTVTFNLSVPEMSLEDVKKYKGHLDALATAALRTGCEHGVDATTKHYVAVCNAKLAEVTKAYNARLGEVAKRYRAEIDRMRSEADVARKSSIEPEPVWLETLGRLVAAVEALAEKPIAVTVENTIPQLPATTQEIVRDGFGQISRVIERPFREADIPDHRNG